MKRTKKMLINKFICMQYSYCLLHAIFNTAFIKYLKYFFSNTFNCKLYSVYVIKNVMNLIRFVNTKNIFKKKTR